ncbi:60S ribosomal protein L19 [Plecturocebus cupreus]
MEARNCGSDAIKNQISPFTAEATAMNMLRLQKRLASNVLCCGKKVWFDSNEINEIANANSHQQMQKLIKDGLIICKPVTVHSRA